MSGPAANTDRVLELAEAVCSKTASKADLAELKSLLLTDQSSCRRYVLYCHMHAALRFEVRADRAAQKVCPEIDIRSIAQASSTADVLDVNIQPAVAPTFLSASFNSTPNLFSSGWPVAYLIATVIFTIGLVIGALVHVSQPVQVVLPSPSDRGARHEGRESKDTPLSPRPSSVVARITGMADCVWEGSGFRGQGAGTTNLPSPSGGHHEVVGAGREGGRESDSPLSTLHSPLVSLGDRLALRSGLLELTYDTGARVILQGPVTYEVESPVSGYLSLGKLTAKLEKKSEVRGQRSDAANQKSGIIGHQFAVRTPTALVTDLGTEFGVEVDRSGTTRSHVFRGAVRFQRLSADGTETDNGWVLHANQSARVADNSSGEIVVTENAKAAGFVRHIPKPIIKVLDLVDVVAGGDGFSGRRGRGIDSTSGRIVDAVRVDGHTPTPGGGQYHRVARMPFVDGVFIPDGGKDEMQVDSAGHVFDGFQGTGNATLEHIWAGGAMPDPFNQHLTSAGGIDYASDGHGLLFLHANNAITFDLDAIRQANPDSKLLRFRATAANTEPVNVGCVADIWVLIDGQRRFQRRQINCVSGVFVVQVPIGKTDRFLTLAATDGGDGVGHDWIIFGDARLELAYNVKPNAKPKPTTTRNQSIEKQGN
jgi:hypothetical protein